MGAQERGRTGEKTSSRASTRKPTGCRRNGGLSALRRPDRKGSPRHAQVDLMHEGRRVRTMRAERISSRTAAIKSRK